MSGDFKIISGGKELSYPNLRILFIVLLSMSSGTLGGMIIMRLILTSQ